MLKIDFASSRVRKYAALVEISTSAKVLGWTPVYGHDVVVRLHLEGADDIDVTAKDLAGDLPEFKAYLEVVIYGNARVSVDDLESELLRRLLEKKVIEEVADERIGGYTTIIRGDKFFDYTTGLVEVDMPPGSCSRKNRK